MPTTTPRERVRRPDGKTWVFDPRSGGRKVHVEHTATGPVLLVTCTHDPAKARDMAATRWAAYWPGVELPAGVLEWRRREMATWSLANTVRQKAIGPSTGTETRSFPVVVFRAPVEAAA